MKVRLGSILEEFKAKPPAGSNPEVLTLTERNGFVRQADRFNKRLATEDVSGYKYIGLDDFAFNPYLLWAGAIARNSQFANGVISPLYPTFRVTTGNYAGYVDRLVLSRQLISAYDNIAFGSVPRRRRSSVKDFLDLEIPVLPPFDEQQRIAAILDKADELRTKRREALAHLDTLTKAIFHSMFGAFARQHVLADAIAGLVGGKNLVGQDDSPNRYRVLKISAVTSGKYLEEESKRLPEGYEPPAEHVVRSGDVIISRANTTELVGASALVEKTDGNTVLPDKLWRAVPSSNVVPRYLLAALQSQESRGEISRRSSGSGGSMKNISKPKLLSVPVALPPLQLQETFAARVSAVERLKELHRKHLAELDALFASLQHRAFKGEL